MNVTIRKLEHRYHGYLAYVKSLCGKATYFLYFTDDIWEPVVLCKILSKYSKATFKRRI